MRILLDTPTHKIIIGDTSPEAELWAKGLREREWRDSELARTDKFAAITDSPKNYTVYRAALRDYPAQSGFPNNERPTE